MTTSQAGELLGILHEHFNPDEEGWLWLALYKDGRDGGVVNQVEGHYEDPAGTARGMALIINQVCADHAYVALCRRDGRPTEADRELWRQLSRQVSSEVLTDMVVFDAVRAWSMRAEDAAAA